ncbi:uncharacterized protein LOC132952714 isoform X1 [Metopolophium dirhodum]|uniref:uncharacterized protein LOC132952714 isoform X1 n=2 Tax=Metopolophium dirhodum TaxID=44670 RepID=UPI00298F4CC8|nr:uncharacterized protein LOC132952714 isoform X1 [Metopolophium dirhodum]
MHPPWLPLCPVVLYLIAGATVLLAADNVTTSTPVQEGLQVRCSNNYTMTCVKRDVLLFLDAMDGERSYELYPGFTLFQRRSPSAGLLPNNESLDAANSSQLDHMIAKRLNDYVESIDLRVRLLNPINATARSVGNSMLERILPFLRMSRKKKDYHGLYWAAGTMAAIGTSALMALSSKALMTAGAALALAIYSCMKGGGGGKGGGSHLTATLMEESTLVPHRQCAEAVVDISGLHNYPADVERYPGSRKTVDIVSPAMPVYRIHQTSEDYSSSYGSSQPQSQAQYP